MKLNFAQDSASTISKVYSVRKLIKEFTYQGLAKTMKVTPATAKLKIDGATPLKRTEVLRLRRQLSKRRSLINEILI